MSRPLIRHLPVAPKAVAPARLSTQLLYSALAMPIATHELGVTGMLLFIAAENASAVACTSVTSSADSK